jgi:hypothetical protein
LVKNLIAFSTQVSTANFAYDFGISNYLTSRLLNFKVQAKF